MRVAVVGKGGSGKSSIAGTLARLEARGGCKVVAIDSDPMPGLSISLGLGPVGDSPLREAAEQDSAGRWRLRRGIGPATAVRRFSLLAPDGVRLLCFDKARAEGLRMGSLNALYRVVHRLAREPVLRDWTIVGDVPAGPRHAAFDWFPYAEKVLVVVEPSWPSVMTARRIARIVTSRRRIEVAFIANKVGRDDAAMIEQRLGVKLLSCVPRDGAVIRADRLGQAPIDHAPAGPFVAAVRGIAGSLRAHNGTDDGRGV